MKNKLALLFTLATVTSLALSACGSTDSPPTDPSYPDLEEQKTGNAAATSGGATTGGDPCPQYLQCPNSLPGYPTFMYAINGCTSGSLVCWYRDGSGNVSSTTLTIPSSCPVCRAPGYTDPRCATITYSQSWTCTDS